MSWGSKGDWGGDDQNPWGRQKNSAGPKSIDELLKNSQDKITNIFKNEESKNKNSGGNGSGGGSKQFTPSPKFFVSVLAASLFLWLSSGIYIIQEDEQAAVTRFGQFVRIANPGLNYHLPSPIEHIIKQKVTRIQREEIGFRSPNGEAFSKNTSLQKNISEESLMLTGDENILDINFVVQWRINNLKDFVFNVVDPYKTVKSAAESAMREIIGKTPIIEAQTAGRSQIEMSVKILLQTILDDYETGVEIVNLQMLKVDPPAEVIDAFRDVQTARADREREINQAYAYYNDIIPRARGNAASIIQQAEGYKQSVIAKSTGEANRFNSVYEQYKNAKEVTRKRIYIETMQNVIGDTNKIILDSKASNLLPYLPIPTQQKITTN
jgi:modulator of FtsH protease HflK